MGRARLFSGALDIIRRSQARSAVCTTDRTRAALSLISTGVFLATGLCCHVGRHSVFCVLLKSTAQGEGKADPATWPFATVAGQPLASVTLLSSSLQAAWGHLMPRQEGRGAEPGQRGLRAPDGSTPESKALFNRCGAEGQPGRVVTLGPREGWAVMLLKWTLDRPVSGSTLHMQRWRVQALGPAGAGLSPCDGASVGSVTVPRPGYLAPCGLSPTDQDPRALHHRTLLFPLLTYISGFGFLFCFLIN